MILDDRFIVSVWLALASYFFRAAAKSARIHDAANSELTPAIHFPV